VGTQVRERNPIGLVVGLLEYMGPSAQSQEEVALNGWRRAMTVIGYPARIDLVWASIYPPSPSAIELWFLISSAAQFNNLKGDGRA
jgi:hypothetical protein